MAEGSMRRGREGAEGERRERRTRVWAAERAQDLRINQSTKDWAHLSTFSIELAVSGGAAESSCDRHQRAYGSGHGKRRLE